ncbi:hypothetical protein PCS_03610 [Desulfocurvibacter africanus PCS]|uniref:CopG-like ribbon-helix-helix domain-containing protein n=1 Tax=Desulfocurvibacter africanus PCS TaxID=1262666 RepID=M5Q0F6_DESAF|nr:hypothetical protein [Desulfocurvibacter africanus]EMG35633.1 hypothetical protein PCS_03610 [Desulfocurvibacter africanus PCS]
MKIAPGDKNLTNLKRYNLALPEELFKEVQAIADQNHTSVLEVLKRFIKLGLIVADISKKADARIIIKENTQERELLFLI